MAQPMQVLRHEEISPETMQHANAHQLGNVQVEYKVRLGKTQIRSIIVLVIVTLIFFFIGFGMLSGGGDSAVGAIIFLLVALVFFIFTGYFALMPVIYRSWRVAICAYGLLYVRGSKIDAFRWDQISAFFIQVVTTYYNGIRTGTRHRYTVRDSDGRKAVFNDRFADAEEIGNAIDYELTRVQLPMAIAAFDAGQSLPFGKLQVSQQGLAKSPQQWLPWQELNDVNVNRGTISIRKKGQMLNWSTISVSRMPNMHIFLALVERGRQMQRSAPPIYPGY
ncbi:DUF6585 family protein [Dictyobacter aurantiacus]|uniref:Uncharacterized protein n=1 Tax=Dictyobacter aurantiacus TaxID=1936993 RepID=A0A401ZD74_9CHLR|nr:DUF6585 family protein [Dictyobacter aurantiacus]GCE04841.1 hypothetical protein KDAU_21700 [Dictyobacter aurantiacus]